MSLSHCLLGLPLSLFPSIFPSKMIFPKPLLLFSTQGLECSPLQVVFINAPSIHLGTLIKYWITSKEVLRGSTIILSCFLLQKPKLSSDPCGTLAFKQA